MTDFEWDPRKEEENVRKHGVSFREAASAFYDTLSTTVSDPEHSVGEHRFVLLGMSNQGRLLVVCHTDRGASPHRSPISIQRRFRDAKADVEASRPRDQRR